MPFYKIMKCYIPIVTDTSQHYQNDQHYIKNHDPIINRGLKASKELLLFNETFNIDFDLKLLIAASISILQLLDLYILLRDNFHLILAFLRCIYHLKMQQVFLILYLLLKSYFDLNKLLFFRPFLFCIYLLTHFFCFFHLLFCGNQYKFYMSQIILGCILNYISQTPKLLFFSKFSTILKLMIINNLP